MSLFNFFKKKEKPENRETSQQTLATPEVKTNDNIEIISVDKGGHGDNFGGLLGFMFMNSEEGGQFINEHIAMVLAHNAVLKNPDIAIHQAGLDVENTQDVKPGIRALKTPKNILSAFPYLQTDYVLPFTPRQIFEWSHIEHREAEIKGGGRDTFGFGFFATDYAVNKEKYRSSEKLQVKVSAIALVFDKSDVTEIEGQQLGEGFASYMPNNDIPHPTYYDFIGVLVDFEPYASNNIAGYLAKVKLINDESNPDFFTVDMFINKENMRTDHLEKGMQVTGVLWFQGELA